MATKKLEDIVFKSMQIVQSQSYRQVTSGGEAIAFPSPTYDSMYGVILGNASARPMVAKKRDEAFRNGIDVVPNFACKCFICEKEYDHKVDRCEKETCKGLVREPNPFEEKILDDLLKIKNSNSQTLEDVLKEISVDHDIADDGWLVSRNVYQELNGEIVDLEVEEFWRIHPGNAAFSMSVAGRIGEYEYTCIYHREEYISNEYANCPVCGRILHPVVAVRFRDQTIEMRYIKEEIFHGSEYNPSAIYGFPPALTMWYNLVLTSAQEKFMADYYVEKKWPTAAIFVPAKKRETAVQFKESLDEKTRKDSQARPVFRFDPDAKHKPEVIRLTDTPEEMQHIPVREDARMRMAAFWGISPIFNADVQASGGMNNESRQITVMSWATETKQKSIQKSYLDRVVETNKVEDWHFELAKIEEEDKAAELQLDNLYADYAQKMQALGFNVDLDDEGKPTKFEKMEAGDDPFGQMQPEAMQSNPFTQTPQSERLGGQQSVLMQKSMKTAADVIWNESYREIKDKLRKIDPYLSEHELGQIAGEVSGKIAGEVVTDPVMEGIDKLYYDNIEKMQPVEPEHYEFNYEYGDWEWKDDYQFQKFEDINIDKLNVHPDYAINKEDVQNESPRVRPKTLDYYANETKEMGPLVVDKNYNLLDGHHRLYALQDKNQTGIRTAIVEPKNNEIATKSVASFLGNLHPRDVLGRFRKKNSAETRRAKWIEQAKREIVPHRLSRYVERDITFADNLIKHEFRTYKVNQENFVEKVDEFADLQLIINDLDSAYQESNVPSDKREINNNLIVFFELQQHILTKIENVVKEIEQMEAAQ